MNAIIFKGYLINKLTYWLFSVIVIILAIIYLKTSLTDANRNIACGASIFVGILLLYYLNRFEPKLIKFNKETLEIFYFNPPQYGKKNGIYSKKDINVVKKNDMIILSNDVEKLAIIRKKALDAKDWENVTKYFE